MFGFDLTGSGRVK